MREGQEAQPIAMPTPYTTQQYPVASVGNYSPSFIYYFNSYCSQFLSVSNLLNQELLKNNNLISDRLAIVPPAQPDPSENKKDS